jgi:hypothetical protein
LDRHNHERIEDILTGADLLAKVRELGDASKSELVPSAAASAPGRTAANGSTSPPSTRPCRRPRGRKPIKLIPFGAADEEDAGAAAA